jgi:carbon-monoxide dehydrogenase large subunit
MLPMYETGRTVTPTLVNPLGVKGAGETGAIAATPAVMNAVVDALAPLGIDHIEAMPLTAERVWTVMRNAKR